MYMFLLFASLLLELETAQLLELIPSPSADPGAAEQCQAAQLSHNK